MVERAVEGEGLVLPPFSAHMHPAPPPSFRYIYTNIMYEHVHKHHINYAHHVYILAYIRIYIDDATLRSFATLRRLDPS